MPDSTRPLAGAARAARNVLRPAVELSFPPTPASEPSGPVPRRFGHDGSGVLFDVVITEALGEPVVVHGLRLIVAEIDATGVEYFDPADGTQAIAFPLNLSAHEARTLRVIAAFSDALPDGADVHVLADVPHRRDGVGAFPLPDRASP